MARKQETPPAASEVKAPASSVDGNALQPEVGILSSSSGAPPLPAAGDGAAPATDSGLAKEHGQELTTGQEGSNADAGGASIQAVDSTTPVPGTGNSEAANQAAPAASNGGSDADQAVGVVDPATNPNPVTVLVYPMRSYMDEGELRRRGGPFYSVPRRHAQELVQRKLASFEPLKE